MTNLFLEWATNKYVTEQTKIRCYGSCQGGCLNPAVCLICCNRVKEFEDWLNSQHKGLYDEFLNSMDCGE